METEVTAQIINLAEGVIAPATGSTIGRASSDQWNYGAVVTGTGAVTATVLIEVSYDGNNWFTWATLTPSGTTSATDTAAPALGAYAFHRARITAISGTGAAVTVSAGGL